MRLVCYVGANLAIPGPGAFRRDLLRLACFERKGRLPRGERRAVDPDLGRHLADNPGDAARLQHQLDTGRLVCAAVNTAECVWLPRGLLPQVEALAEVEKVDRRLAFQPIDFPWRSSLVLPQWRAVEQIVQQGGGLVIAPPGAGKTRMASAVVTCWRQPAAWLTHRRDLVNQARSDMLTYWNLPPEAIGQVGDDGDWFGTHMTVCMLQSLASRPKRLAELAARVGAVVVDEAHHSSSITHAGVIQAFPAAHRLALTATIDRPDGMGALVRAIAGPGYTLLDQADLIDAGLIVLPSIRLIDSGYFHSGSGDWAFLQRSRALDYRRNLAVCAIVAQEMRRGSRVAVLVSVKDHAALLAELLPQQFGIPAAAVVGTVPTEIRRRIYDGTAAGRMVVIATQLFDEGLNIPEIDVLVMAAPGRSPIQVVQRVGRIMRAWRGKSEALVYDLCDMAVETLADQARARYQLYLERGWRVERQGA